MHERLLEMGKSLPAAPSPTPKPRDTYVKEQTAQEEGSFGSYINVSELGGTDTPDAEKQGMNWSTLLS